MHFLYLLYCEIDVSVLIFLICVKGLSIIPKQITLGQAVLTQTYNQMKGLTAAHPQGGVRSLKHKHIQINMDTDRNDLSFN